MYCWPIDQIFSQQRHYLQQFHVPVEAAFGAIHLLLHLLIDLQMFEKIVFKIFLEFSFRDFKPQILAHHASLSQMKNESEIVFATQPSELLHSHVTRTRFYFTYDLRQPKNPHKRSSSRKSWFLTSQCRFYVQRSSSLVGVCTGWHWRHTRTS